MLNISVIIPAYNEEKYLGHALKSLFENAPPDSPEVIVVNNASTDKTAEIALAFQGVKVVNELQKGLTRARQTGLEAASGDILAFIDADTLVSKDWFKILSREFSRDESLACLSGPYHYYGLPKHENIAGRFWNNAWLKIWHWFIDRITVLPTGYVIMGGNFAAKKSALLAVGGFNTQIEFYGEDTDIARRLRKIGRVKFLNDFWVYSSARRFHREGLIRTALKYLVNYLSVVVLKRPVTSKHSDVR